jgi:hypothetical protein
MAEEANEGFISRHFKTLVFGIAVAALALSLLIFLSNQGLVSIPVAKPDAGVTGDAGGTPSTPGAGTTPSGDPIFTQQQAGSDTGSPIIDAISGEQTGVKCPNDYCLNPVQGAGNCPASTGKAGEPYTEQECYDYPDQADNLTQCDQKRTVYYQVCGVRQ